MRGKVGRGEREGLEGGNNQLRGWYGRGGGGGEGGRCRIEGPGREDGMRRS